MWGVPGAILALPMPAILKIVNDGVRPLKSSGASKDKTISAPVKGERVPFQLRGRFSKWMHPTPSSDVIVLCSNRIEAIMTDPYQVNSIIAVAICEARGDHPDKRMDSDEAQRIAKCIAEALTGAGLKIVPSDTR